MNSILITIPSISSSLHSHTAGALYMLGKLLDKNSIQNYLFILNNHSFIPSARNIIANTFINTNCSHLLCIDSDIGFTAEDVLTLLNMNEEFASAHYRRKSETGARMSSVKKDDKLIGVGFGFCLLTRSVFEKLNPICDKVITNTDEGAIELVDYFGPLKQEGRLLSEDLSFCSRWISIGGHISLNTKIKLVHYGVAGFREP